jgi:membrane associated rhomboid family serine protease
MEMSVTLVIVLLTVGISILAFNNPKWMDDLIFDPGKIKYKNQYYRFISSGFIHADYIHLAFNMLSLYMFGEYVEKAFDQLFGEKGKLLYTLMYLLALVVSLLPTYQKNKHNPNYLGLGASGAVSAVVFAGLLLTPTILIGLFILPPIIPGFIFGPLYLILSGYLAKKGGDNINHSAHIWGALFGLGFIIAAGYLIANYPVIQSCMEQISWYLKEKGIG